MGSRGIGVMETLATFLDSHTAVLVISSALLAWAVIITHWPNVPRYVRISLFVGLPLIVVGLFFGLLALYADTIDKNILAKNVSEIRGKSEGLQIRLDSLGSELDGLAVRIQEINRNLDGVQKATSGLSTALEQASQDINTVLTRHTAALQEIQKNGKNLSKSIEDKRAIDDMNAAATRDEIESTKRAFQYNSMMRNSQQYQYNYNNNNNGGPVIGVPLGHGLTYGIR
jgi:archaellum component FlaC